MPERQRKVNSSTGAMARKEAAPRREPLSSPLGKINQDAESHPTQQNSRERPGERQGRSPPTKRPGHQPEFGTRSYGVTGCSLHAFRAVHSCACYISADLTLGALPAWPPWGSSTILQHNSQVIKDATQQRTCSLLMLSVYVKHGAWALATHHASAKASAELLANDNSEGAGR